jgi:hypothetical protein
MLEGGIELWELKPVDGGKVQKPLLRSSGASLHTKALLMDHKTVFVGSDNLDPRRLGSVGIFVNRSQTMRNGRWFLSSRAESDRSRRACVRPAPGSIVPLARLWPLDTNALRHQERSAVRIECAFGAVGRLDGESTHPPDRQTCLFESDSWT